MSRIAGLTDLRQPFGGPRDEGAFIAQSKYTVKKIGNYYYAIEDGTNRFIATPATDPSGPINAALALGGRVHLKLDGEWDYGTTLSIIRHGTTLVCERGSTAGIYALRFTGVGPAIKTVADIGNYLTGLKIYDLPLNARGNANVTYGLQLEDVQHCSVYNPDIFDIITAAGEAIRINRNVYAIGPVQVNLYSPFTYNVRNALSIQNGAQIVVDGPQFNGMPGGSGAGSNGIYQAANSYELTVVGPTIVDFEDSFHLEGDKWVLIRPQMENATNGVNCPNFFYRGAIINPAVNVVVNRYAFPAGGRCDILDPEIGSFAMVKENAGVPTGAEFNWLTQLGHVLDTTNKRLYHRTGAGVEEYVAKRVWEKIFEYTVAGAAVTTIDTGAILDLAANKAYMFLLKIYNPTVGTVTYYLEYNGDTTVANYRNQQVWFSAGASGPQRNSDSSILDLLTVDNGALDGTIQADVAGRPRCNLMASKAAAASIELWLRAHIWNNTANVTSLQIRAGTASGIGIGSKLILFKVTPF